MQQAEERLSAFVDDELEGPAGALIERLVEDPEQRERWARYHLMGEVLRDRDAPHVGDLRARIAAALDAEPTVLTAPVPTAPARRAAVRPARRWALAAGLGAAAVLGAALVSREPPPAAPPLAAGSPGPLVGDPAAGGPEAQVVSWDGQGTPSATNAQALEFHRRLNSYLVNFNEQRASLGVPGVHPYVRIVGFDEAAGTDRR
jgi:sigma-E factor negative regulatory protein RseA